MSGIIDWLLRPWRVRKLKNKYFTLLRFSKDESERVLKQQLITLKAKRPGQPEEWYLEQIIKDLQRHRRRKSQL